MSAPLCLKNGALISFDFTLMHRTLHMLLEIAANTRGTGELITVKHTVTNY